PATARNRSPDATLHPWNIAMIDSGLAALTEQSKPMDLPPSVRARIARLRADLDAEDRRRKDLGSAGKPLAAIQSADEARDMARELNQLLRDVDQYELRTATALWIEKTFPIGRSFLEATQSTFGSVAFPIAFRQNKIIAC